MSLNNLVNKGMTENELLDVCRDDLNHPYFRGAPFWTAEIYSFGKHIRRYGYYPKFLPLAIYTDHGPEIVPTPPFDSELNSTAPTMFYHSPASVENWKRFSKKPCYPLFSPFVFYRRQNKVETNQDAQGTIVFVDHSTLTENDHSDWQKYIDQLKLLPIKFQPVSVCLHITDIKKGRYKIFMDNNIPVYTAGGNSEDFAENFYNILKKFKYASSNAVGSSLFYSVEMGIPFFIYGNKPHFINIGNPNFPLGEYNQEKRNPLFGVLEKMFISLNCDLNKEKKELIAFHLGLYDGVSRLKMFLILYGSLFKWIFSFRFLKWLSLVFSEYKKLNKIINI